MIIAKFNELSEIAIKTRKEHAFLEKMQSGKNNLNNILEISGSKTPDSRLNNKFFTFTNKVEDFDLKVKKKTKKKSNFDEKTNPETLDSIENILKDFENQENNRKIKNLLSIVCFIVNSLTEIRPSDVKIPTFSSFFYKFDFSRLKTSGNS